ncbi:OLC1v1019574C1 [Oldenlandia corymbosa var. corymbosa]|uniref:OLC1v1019574C1 n=1 Tax=Oldenlandia corymbosa var. corymbosa TaxID=529605 RepID=A0AAV1EEE3_OLDCO|nr:OLC1v1019574C1 [Oldenlandia corymbosa var. corymbosa]
MAFRIYEGRSPPTPLDASEFSEEEHDIPLDEEFDLQFYLALRRGPRYVLQEEDVAESQLRYTNCMLAYLADDCHYSFERMQTYLDTHWAPEAQLLSHYRNFYVIWFANPLDCRAIFHNGPYAIDGALLLVRRWTPYTPLPFTYVTRALVWVRLCGLSPECFNVHAGFRAASLVGPVAELQQGLRNNRILDFLQARAFAHQQHRRSTFIPPSYVTANHQFLAEAGAENFPDGFEFEFLEERDHSPLKLYRIQSTHFLLHCNSQ